MELSPVILFVYNRPWHTACTLEALLRNRLADRSTLYIFCDGLGSDATVVQQDKINEVRRIVREKKWCREVHIIEQDKNKGLAGSIISGVTEITSLHGRVIVLEDDLLTSPGFLTYMNDALNFYRDREEVMHISGYWFPVRHSERLPETFFYNTATCWGWGTWARSWSRLETDPVVLREKIIAHPGGTRRFNIEDSMDFMIQLENNISGKMSTWAIKWYGTMFISNGFALHPNRSLVNNIGHDGSGVHSARSAIYHWDKLADSIKVEDIPIRESAMARKMIRRFYRKHNPRKRDNKMISLVKRNIPPGVKQRLKSLKRIW